MAMQEVRDATAKILDSTTLADLLKRVDGAVNDKRKQSVA
jgi:DNA-binding IscR family transcriptional regulator